MENKTQTGENATESIGVTEMQKKWKETYGGKISWMREENEDLDKNKIKRKPQVVIHDWGCGDYLLDIHDERTHMPENICMKMDRYEEAMRIAQEYMKEGSLFLCLQARAKMLFADAEKEKKINWREFQEQTEEILKIAGGYVK